MIKITDDMKDRISKAFDEKKYCVLATTSRDGYPDLSFRGSTHVFDDEHIPSGIVHWVPAAPISKTILMSACSTMTPPRAPAGVFMAPQQSIRKVTGDSRS